MFIYVYIYLFIYIYICIYDTVTRASLFAHQLGMYAKELEPVIDGSDTQFILSIIKQLLGK
jgi:hypothetical protein